MTSFWFVFRRLVQAVTVIFFVTVVVFLLLDALPGGPARGILGPDATEQQIAAFNASQGLDQPAVVRYVLYLGRTLSGDLGVSYGLNAPVTELLAERLPKTLVLTTLAALVALVIAVPLGLLQAVRQNRLVDYIATVVTFVLYATPVFFFGLILIIAFSQAARWFPSQAPQGQTVGDVLAEPQALVLPVLAGAAGLIAVFSRYTRSATLENLSEDYVRTALATGTPYPRIIRQHVLRNSLTPLIAMLGYQIPVLFGGTLVVEQLFNYPGMGLLFWNAAQSSDYPVLLGCVLIIAIATVLGSLLADLAQSVIDPRVRSTR